MDPWPIGLRSDSKGVMENPLPRELASFACEVDFFPLLCGLSNSVQFIRSGYFT